MEHASRRKISCPLCGTSINDHHDLVIHANAVHASGNRTFSVEAISFNSKSAFQDWKHALEEEETTRYAVHSKNKGTDGDITYMRCSRAEPGPSYIEKCSNSKKKVMYCTAYMKVTENERTINVEFCRTHCGHEPDAALLTMDASAEKQILSCLRNGFTYKQVLSQIRERCRNSNNLSCRLYFTTSRDVRRIALKHNLDPARRHSIDILSLEMRIGEHIPDDGIRHYTAATDASGDNFSLVIVTPIQKIWLESYAKRALLMDDTFNLTPYSLRLASVVVLDEWDMGLPAAFLLSFKMTENEVSILFQEIVLLPQFDTAYFMSDDSNSFYNGFIKVVPQSMSFRA
ncbi:unnamed protein product [Cylicocyclus nassatus]|uniref:C2H2-type domain-containing protein n=1 Tax=Cylicocyclus nassatus TaxID=53992 RepID=A0AA36GN16_CYLNA|nr:unnamed protein product [Cylicocyclus nassatus]